ncbi:MAG: spore germination protein [Clostridiales bacterium]|nr:spore germination protein [Clostridiales bacterium]
MQRLNGFLDNDVSTFDNTLRVNDNFDIIKRELVVSGKRAVLYYIDGFIKASSLQKLLIYLTDANGFGDGQPGAAKRFADEKLPDVEVEISSNVNEIIKNVLAGCCAMLADGFGPEAAVIDLRSYPSRETQDPENDRVIRGARDGFVETLIFNTALVRRRIRDTALTMKYISVGEKSQTDVVVAYIEGTANKRYVDHVIRQIGDVKTDALAMGSQSLMECLARGAWYNPFPRVRFTERPDSAAAHLLEGGVIVLCDGSPEAMMLPTSIFNFLQETNDYYFPPLTGTYLRLVRYVVFASTIFITPLWYLFLMHTEILPEWLHFVIPSDTGKLPVIVQLFITEFALDTLKLASLTTPSTMSNSLSIIGGLLIGDFAVDSGWLIPEVIFYMGFTAIANFTQSSYELGYAFKFFRMTLLLLTALFSIWGFIIGIVFILIMLLSATEICGGKYLYPLIPFNGGALMRIIIRHKKQNQDQNS